MMIRTVKALQSIGDTPLQLDSTIPEVLEAALRVYNGKPIVNSVNGEEASLQAILPLVKKYGAAVVGLTLDENGIPKKQMTALLSPNAFWNGQWQWAFQNRMSILTVWY